MQLAQAMEALGTHLGVAPLKSEQGTYKLVFDDQLAVEFWELDKERFIAVNHFFSIPIGQPLRKDFFKDLLQLSYTLIGTQQQTFALDEEQKALISYQVFHVDSLYDTVFIKQLETFLNNLEFWQNVAKLNNNSDLIASSPLFVP